MVKIQFSTVSCLFFPYNDDCIRNYTQCCFIDARDHCEQILDSFLPSLFVLLVGVPFGRNRPRKSFRIVAVAVGIQHLARAGSSVRRRVLYTLFV